MDAIPLSSAIAEIRRELKIAMLTADDQVALEVADIELELTLEITQSKTKGAGVAVLGVVDGKADSTKNESQLHRIKLTLHPKKDDETLRLSDADDIEED
ncbi:trypco2 family protein [Glycomyces sp. NPDC048151]|uniref:trypco2 family protein n=1 Tax=Glycomyces sp. NPDC048151 TaxID=3364002 RepID=UPI0037240744